MSRFQLAVPPCHAKIAQTPPDSRQSETSLFVARGTRRLLRRLNFSTVTELPLLSGRRADIVAPAMDATILIVEIKSSIADFRADTKWRNYRAHCDKLFFAIPETMPIEIMPDDAGSSWPTPMARKFCARRRNIAWPRPLAVPCSSALRMRRRIACTA